MNSPSCLLWIPASMITPDAGGVWFPNIQHSWPSNGGITGPVKDGRGWEQTMLNCHMINELHDWFLAGPINVVRQPYFEHVIHRGKQHTNNNKPRVIELGSCNARPAVQRTITTINSSRQLQLAGGSKHFFIPSINTSIRASMDRSVESPLVFGCLTIRRLHRFLKR